MFSITYAAVFFLVCRQNRKAASSYTNLQKFQTFLLPVPQYSLWGKLVSQHESSYSVCFWMLSRTAFRKIQNACLSSGLNDSSRKRPLCPLNEMAFLLRPGSYVKKEYLSSRFSRSNMASSYLIRLFYMFEVLLLYIVLITVLSIKCFWMQ